MRVLGTIVIFFLANAGFCSAGIAAAAPALAAPREGWALLAHADSLFRSRQPDSALVLLEPLLQESRRREDPKLFRAARLTQGEILATVGRAIPAEAVLRDVLASIHAPFHDQQDAAVQLRATRWLAYALDLQGRMAEAASYYERVLESALSLGDQEHEGYARLGLAHLELLAGHPLPAAGGFEQAVTLFRQLGSRRYELIALTGLACCHDALGNRDRARSVFAEVVQGSRAIGDPYTEAHALNNLGRLEFLIGDPGAAVELYQRARDLQLSGGNPEGSLVPAKNIAVALTYMGRLDEAVGVLETALSLCEQQGYLGQKAMVLEQLGIVRRLQGRLTLSAALLRAAAVPGADADLEEQVRVFLGLAETLAAMDSIGAALSILEDKAVQWQGQIPLQAQVDLDRLTGELYCRVGAIQPALDHLLRAESAARRLGLSMERIAPLTQSAWCYRSLERPDSSMALLLRACGVWETLRGRSRDPEWREQLGVDARLLYISLGDLVLAYPADRPAEERARIAFELLQRFKARTLYERMTGPVASGADTSLAWPDVALGVADLQQVLEEGELFLDVYLGSKSSLLFAVDRRECRGLQLPGLEGGLGPSLERYRGLLAHPPDDPGSPETEHFLAAAGSALSDLLLLPVADLISGSRRIIVAPDGPLNLIPVGALGIPGNSGARDEPLLARQEVVCVPSAALLVELRRRSCRNGAGEIGTGVLAVAARGGAADSSLPGAVQEVRWLAGRFRGVDLRTRSGPAVRAEELSRYQILHLAAHTRLDDQRPWRSGIVQVSSDSSREGDLLAAEIASLHLKARLAVLSGCESAGGRVLSGEGVLGLTGAFAAAGVPAVIATLWPVQDRATVRLMKGFYTALGRGQAAAAALREAQQAMRDDPQTHHPFYWAGFVLVGDGSVRVDLRERPWWRRNAVLLLPALLVAVVVTGGLVWRRSLACRKLEIEDSR
jgi:CHAT domain-containing protein/Flp pilus assembly protein TadD